MTQGNPQRGNGSGVTNTSRPARLPRSARIAAGIAAVIIAVHVFFTAVYNTPYEDVRNDVLPGAAAARYINPYLQQDYRIFAPNPANSDRNLWLRAWVETPDGERVTTKWVDATTIELAEPARRVLRKQLTVQASLRLTSSYFDLSERQREIAAQNFHQTRNLEPLQDALIESDEDNDAAVGAFIRATNFATSYATQAARALWSDDGEIIAVQTRSVSSPIIRWDDRFDEDATAPGSSYTALGWRPTMEWEHQSEAGFAKSFLRWAERAGVSGSLTDDGEHPGDTVATDGGTDDGGGAGGEE